MDGRVIDSPLFTDSLWHRRVQLAEWLYAGAFLVFSNENAHSQSLFYLTGFAGEGNCAFLSGRLS